MAVFTRVLGCCGADDPHRGHAAGGERGDALSGGTPFTQAPRVSTPTRAHKAEHGVYLERGRPIFSR